jgi:hypothetical protein
MREALRTALLLRFPFPVFSSSHSASFRADRECSAPPLFHSATAEPGLGVVLFSFCG